MFILVFFLDAKRQQKRKQTSCSFPTWESSNAGMIRCTNTNMLMCKCRWAYTGYQPARWCEMIRMPEQAAIHRKMSKHFQPKCGSAATTGSGIIIDNGMKRHVWGWFKGGGRINKMMLGINKQASDPDLHPLYKYSCQNNSCCYRGIKMARKFPW